MTTGVVVMSYGTPAEREAVAPFYTDVRHGRPPSPEQLAELLRRYDAIGGLSPLTARSAAQVAGIRAHLEDSAPGHFAVAYGTKHAAPSVEEAVDTLAARGVEALVGIVLAPHYSALSVGEYLERLEAHAASCGITAVGRVECFGAEPALIDLLATRVLEAIEQVGTPPERTEVLFSAHSLPARIVAMGDPYPEQLATTARLVAGALGLESFRNVWQSASTTPEPWLGPDISLVLEELAAAGTAGVVVCPVGFTSDHLEVLYDLDLLARSRAAELGLAFVRTPSLNDDPTLMACLAGLIQRAEPAAR